MPRLMGAPRRDTDEGATRIDVGLLVSGVLLISVALLLCLHALNPAPFDRAGRIAAVMQSGRAADAVVVRPMAATVVGPGVEPVQAVRRNWLDTHPGVRTGALVATLALVGSWCLVTFARSTRARAVRPGR